MVHLITFPGIGICGIWRESYSMFFTKAKQLASNSSLSLQLLQINLLQLKRALKSFEHHVDNISITSNQFDSAQAQAPGHSSQLQGDVISADTNQLTSTRQTPNSSNLQVDVISPATNQLASTEQVEVPNPSELQVSLTPNQVAPPRNWAELDRDLTSKIFKLLPTNEDFLSCKMVCRWFRSVCSVINMTPNPQPPWIMLPEARDSHMRSFFSFDRNKYYKIELHTAHGRRCFDSPHGWIVTIGTDGEIHLLNPLTQDRRKLPPLRPVTVDWFHVIHKLMVFKSSPNEFLVMAIYGSRNQLAFVRLGETEWNTVRDVLQVRDVAHIGDQFNALHTNGTLVRIKFNRGRNFACAEFIASPPEDLKIPDEVYLVNSSSTCLWGVFRYRLVLNSKQETENFLVYKFDLDTEEWEKLDDLGGCAIFVGDGNSWSIHVCADNVINAKSNRIYYVDDYWVGEVTYSGHDIDIGVFSMASGRVELLNIGGEGVDFPFYRPIWFMRRR